MVSFDHRDPGTAASAWDDRFDAPALELGDATGIVVLAPHPDDETLGAGGLLATAARAGLRTEVVLATLGEASHPGSPEHPPQRLAELRRHEFALALRGLHPAVLGTELGLPDGGGLEEHRGALAEAVEAALDRAGAAPVLVAPWRADGHRDHRIAGEIAEAIAARRGVRLLEHPIWLWHWGGGKDADAPWPSARVLRLDDAAHRAKSLALRAYRSQTEPLSAHPADAAILHPGMQAHFERPAELFFEAGSRGAEHFDEHYRRRPEGWDFDSWYERRKRAVLLAALPHGRYTSALELGCATGELAAQLAERADAVLGIDVAEAALETARRAVPQARFERRELPAEWPDGRFDLIVVSELGYYLSPEHLAELGERITASLVPDGVLVLCHWRHPDRDAVLGGDAVHRAVIDAWSGGVVAHHEEPDFVLDVLVLGEASVARREGLLP